MGRNKKATLIDGEIFQEGYKAAKMNKADLFPRHLRPHGMNKSSWFAGYNLGNIFKRGFYHAITGDKTKFDDTYQLQGDLDKMETYSEGFEVGWEYRGKYIWAINNAFLFAPEQLDDPDFVAKLAIVSDYETATVN